MQITRHIREQILTGVLGHKQALPSTRQLADEWDVSVKTISTALAPLITEGLVISRYRAGRVVNAPETQTNLFHCISQLEADIAVLRARLDQLESVPAVPSVPELSLNCGNVGRAVGQSDI